MIFNYTIFGIVSEQITDEAIKITYYDKTLTQIYSKNIPIVNNSYQINLGDRDLLTINGKLEQGCSVLLTIGDIYCKRLILDLSSNILRHDIEPDDTDLLCRPATAIEPVTYHSISDRIQVGFNKDDGEYNYFMIEDSNGVKVYESNSTLDWSPKLAGSYKITQRSCGSEPMVVVLVTTVMVMTDSINTTSVDYIFQVKKNKICRINLPDYVRDTLILPAGFYFQDSTLIGRVDTLKPKVLSYYRGEVIIQAQIGDIIDY